MKKVILSTNEDVSRYAQRVHSGWVSTNYLVKAYNFQTNYIAWKNKRNVENQLGIECAVVELEYEENETID